VEKCNLCSNNYPEATLRKMVQIIDRKAYLHLVCPSCQSITINNPNYYYFIETKQDEKHLPEA